MSACIDLAACKTVPPAELSACVRPFASGTALWTVAQLNSGDTDSSDEYCSLPAEIQERHLARAALLALLGVRTELIWADPDEGGGVRWGCVDWVDPVLSEFIEPLLDMAADRAVVYRFARSLADGTPHGRVNAALGAALLGACHELDDRVCAAWRQVGSATASAAGVVRAAVLPLRMPLAELRLVVTEHGGHMNGWEVLKLLEKRTAIQPFGASTPTGPLLAEAAAPLLAAVEGWVLRADDDDELPFIRAGDDPWTWQERQNELPLILQGCVGKALRCGQLMYLLGRCGTSVPDMQWQLEFRGMEAAVYEAQLLQPFYRLNEIALTELRRDLLTQIDVARNFVLCGGGAWVQEFLDYAAASSARGLELPVERVRWMDLQRYATHCWASEAQRAGLPSDMVEKLRIDVAEETVVRALRRVCGTPAATAAQKPSDGLSAACVRMTPAWAVGKVLDWSWSEGRYDVLGRVMLRIKCLTHMLVSGRPGRHTSREDRGLCALWAEMLRFLRTLEQHLATEVIEPAFRGLRTAVLRAATVDEITSAHKSCLSACMKGALAGAPGVYKRLEAVLLGVKLFAAHAKSRVRASSASIVDSFKKQFHSRLAELIGELQREAPESVEEVRGLLSRLDFNCHYRNHGLYT